MDATAVEGNNGTTAMEFVVNLSAVATEEVTVDYETAARSAVAPDDYAAATGTLTFSTGGPTSQTISIDVIGDNITEGDEQFVVELSNPSGATILDGQATGVIEDDEELSDDYFRGSKLAGRRFRYSNFFGEC